MTPRELIEAVTAKFDTLYVGAAKQDQLLKDALADYQRLAGPFKKVSTVGTATSIAKPTDYLSIAICYDARKRWHEVLETDTNLVVVTTSASVAPYNIFYFVNLAELDIEKGIIPPECIPLLRRYLHNLLEIANTARARDVMQATGVQLDLSSDDELQTRKASTEQEIEDTQAMVPGVIC